MALLGFDVADEFVNLMNTAVLSQYLSLVQQDAKLRLLGHVVIVDCFLLNFRKVVQCFFFSEEAVDVHLLVAMED